MASAWPVQGVRILDVGWQLSTALTVVWKSLHFWHIICRAVAEVPEDGLPRATGNVASGQLQAALLLRTGAVIALEAGRHILSCAC